MTEPDKSPQDTASQYKEINSEIVFHYSREHRLSRASAAVSKHNSNPYVKPGLAKRILGSRFNLFILVSIFMIFIMIMLDSRDFFNRAQGGITLGHNIMALSVLEEESILILSIQKTRPIQREAYIGPVDIIASPAQPAEGEEPAFLIRRIFFGDSSQEVFNFTLPFEGDELIVILQAEDETQIQRVRKEK